MGIKSGWVLELVYKLGQYVGDALWVGEGLYQEHERSKDEAEIELGLDREVHFLGLKVDFIQYLRSGWNQYHIL